MSKKRLAVGDTIPAFSLPNHNNDRIQISPTDGKKRIIYFYPKNNTRNCTEEACSFRDWQDDFLNMGYEVIGISTDSVASHLKFKAKHQLNFSLLSDTKGEVRKMFAATTALGLVTARKTFLVDEKGKILLIHDAFMEGEEHVKKMLHYINEERPV